MKNELVRRPEANIGGMFRIQRDLAVLTRDAVLRRSPLKPDKLDLMIDLYRAAQGATDFADNEGFISFRTLQTSLMVSQSQAWRQVSDGEQRGWIKTAAGEEGGHGNARRAHITEEGITMMKPVLDRLKQLAENFFEGVSEMDRITHFRVTQHIRQQLRPYPIDAGASGIQALENVLAVKRACKELVPLIKQIVLANSSLTLERADILVDLHGAWKLGWDDPLADDEGFVRFERLQFSLVHSQTITQILLSRRVRDLEQQRLLETKKRKEEQKYLGKSDGMRITDSGVVLIAPVWERYKEFAKEMLENVESKDRETHIGVNDHILQKLRPAWTRLL